MKKQSKFKAFLDEILWIVYIPIVILLGLFLLIYTPVDYLKYRFSSFRKQMKLRYGKEAKYTWLIATSYYFKIFERIEKHGLPLQYFRDPKVTMGSYGYFYCEGTLFVVDMVPRYNHESGSWYVIEEDSEADLQSYMDSEMQAFRECVQDTENLPCNRMVFLVDEEEVYKEDREIAKDVPFLLIYDVDSFPHVIREFLEKTNEPF